MERSVKHRAAAVFGTPESSMAEPRIVVMRGLVSIENHCGIERYDADCIAVACALGTVRISGAELTIRRYRRDDMTVAGDVRAVELINTP